MQGQAADEGAATVAASGGSARAAKIRAVVHELALDLRGRTVLTEAATGPYVVTSVIAAAAGARVLALAKDSVHGSAGEAAAQTRAALAEMGRPELDVTILEELSPEVVSAADVITNSGHLRPLDESVLRDARDNAVIPLMYEAWEWREGDVDLAYARSRGIQVGATNERHPDVDVFGYLGDMALRQVFDAGLCPYRNRFVLVANNDFGSYIARVLGKVSDGVAVVAPDEHRDRYAGMTGVDWVGGFPGFAVPEGYRDAEAVVFTAYPFDRTWIGAGLPIDVTELAGALDHPLLLRYAGDVDTASLAEHGVRYFPDFVASGHMGVLPSAVGLDPVIRLQAGGLKSAEAMLTGVHDHRGEAVVELL